MKNLPNVLTISRLVLLAPLLIMIYLPNDQLNLISVILFILIALTDFFDGFFARRQNITSEFGKMLDPIADKLLIVFVLIGLSINLDSFLIGFISAIIISREIWVAALRDINARNNQSDKTKVTFLAKTKTAIQMLSILIYLFGLTINNMMVLFFADIILIIALLVTIQTGFQYTISTFKK